MLMEQSKYCLHCMRIMPEFAEKCPHCGSTEPCEEMYPNALPPRTVLMGRYLTGRVLVHDDLGFIYLALDLQTNQLCELRELFPKNLCSRDPEYMVIPSQEHHAQFGHCLSRVQRQAHIYSMMDQNGNDAIALLQNAFVEKGTYMLVFPHHDGLSLSEYVTRNGHLTPAETFSLFVPVARTLSRFHSFGVTHGAVHPEKLRYLSRGELLLSDFRCKGMGDSDAYTPAQTADLDCTTDRWVDGYALAGCLYFSLTGSEPLEGKDGISKMLRQLRQIPGLDRQFLVAFANARTQGMNDSLSYLLQTMKSVSRFRRPILWSLISAVSCVIMVLTFLLGGSGVETAPGGSTTETTLNTVPSQLQEQTVPSPADVTLGSYLFANYADPSLILGIEGGFCDNGARLILTSYDPVNYNRILITDHDPGDGYYNLQAAHTNSFLSAGTFGQVGDAVNQYFSMRGLDSEKWLFLNCGQEDNRTIYTLVDASGLVLAPQDGNTVAGNTVVLSRPDESDPSQKWYLVWNERDADFPSITVLQPGDPIPAPEDPVEVAFGGAFWSLTEDGRLGVSEISAPLTLRFDPNPDGGYRMTASEGADYLEYVPEENCLVLREFSDSPNQVFHLLYGGFGTCQIRTADGVLLHCDSSINLIRGAVGNQNSDLSIFALKSK